MWSDVENDYINFLTRLEYIIILITRVLIKHSFRRLAFDALRYMVASRELQAGEEIITEMPFVIGPKACTYPLCLSCFTPWPPESDNKPLCSKCKWPICGQDCENASQHKDYECQVKLQLNSFYISP